MTKSIEDILGRLSSEERAVIEEDFAKKKRRMCEYCDKNYQKSLHKPEETYTNSVRVLWVDDDAIIQTMAENILSTLVDDADVVGSGQEALELLAKKPYDLMITDIGMPKMSGWQLAKQIKGKHPRMEVAIMSGHYYELSQEIKNQYGIGYIYTKPIQRDQIKSLISEIQKRINNPS